MVMSKLGLDLRKKIKDMSVSHLPTATVLMIGLQIIDRLRDLHELGYVHKDLKLENICLGSTNMKSSACSQIFLVDFGISERYLDLLNVHLPDKTSNVFEGNLKFCSKNAHQFTL